MERILSGIRVLDFTDALAGPYCATQLAACGCDVINIEPPGGKVTRTLPPYHGEYSIDFMYNHCGKKSIVIDLKAEGARDLVMKLAEISDIVLENYRPGVMARFGLDYAAFKEVNPAIIMCSISAFGQNGPYAELMGVDVITQAQSGIVHMSSKPGQRPGFVSFPISDILAAVTAYGAICAALYRRSQTDKGEYIDIAMCDCLLAAVYNAVGTHILSKGEEEYRYMVGSFSPNFSPCGAYKGRDGYLALFLRTDVGWVRLAELMGKPELATDPRFATIKDRCQHNDEVTEIIEQWLQGFEHVSEVAALLQSYRMLAVSVSSIAQVIEENPQFKARDMLVEMQHPTLGPVKFINTPLRFQNHQTYFDGPPPMTAGENEDYVLRDLLNLTDDKIEVLKKSGVVSATGKVKDT